jgi:hypothetical protein
MTKKRLLDTALFTICINSVGQSCGSANPLLVQIFQSKQQQ